MSASLHTGGKPALAGGRTAKINIKVASTQAFRLQPAIGMATQHSGTHKWRPREVLNMLIMIGDIKQCDVFFKLL
jgi:hypothetical protein